MHGKHPIAHCFPRLRRSLALTATLLSVVIAGCGWLTLPNEALAGGRVPASGFDALYLEARLAMAEGLPEQAAQRLERGLRRSDCPPHFYVARAELDLQHGAHDSARELLEDGLRRYPDHDALLLMLAQVEDGAGRVDRAIGHLERVLTLQPERRGVLERLSQLRLKRFRHVTTSEQLQVEVELLIEVYERMLELSEGRDRLGPLLVLSSLYLRVDQGEKALETAQEAVTLRATDPRPHQSLGAALQALGRQAEALACYRRALVINVTSMEALRGVKEILRTPREQNEFWRGLAEEHPQHAAIQYQYSQVLLEVGELEAAEDLLRRSAGQWPEDVRFHMNLVAVLQAQERLGEAFEALVEGLRHDRSQDLHAAVTGLLAANPDPAARQAWQDRLAVEFPARKDIQELVARMLIGERRWSEAESRLNHILRHWPEDQPARLARVRAWLALDRLETAETEARALLSEGSELAPMVALALADELVRRNRSQEAFALVREARAQFADDESLVVWLGWMLVEADNGAEALTMLESFRETHPDLYGPVPLLVDLYARRNEHMRAHVMLDNLPGQLVLDNQDNLLLLRANLFRRQGRLLDALDAMQGLLARNSENATYYVEAGLINQELGRNDQAERHYRRAIEVSPQDPEGWNTLGYFFAETGQKLDEALDLATRALVLKPDAGHIVDTLGWIYYQRGEYEKAVESLTRAVRLLGDHPDPVVLDHLGDALAKVGNLVAAREAWSRALELGPENPELIRDKLEQLRSARIESAR